MFYSLFFFVLELTRIPKLVAFLSLKKRNVKKGCRKAQSIYLFEFLSVKEKRSFLHSHILCYDDLVAICRHYYK